MTGRHGTPLAVVVSAANEHDVRFIVPLIFLHFPRVGGLPGRPRELPKVVRADAGYTSKDLLWILSEAGIAAEIPQRGHAVLPGLGRRRWPVERAIAWLKQYRRVGIRRDRTLAVFDAFTKLACGLIAFKQLTANGF